MRLLDSIFSRNVLPEILRKPLKLNLPVILLYMVIFPALTQIIYHGYENLGMTEWLPMVGLTTALVIYCGWQYAVFLIPVRLFTIYLNLGDQMDFFLNLTLVTGTAGVYALMGFLGERYYLKTGRFRDLRSAYSLILLILIGALIVPGPVFLLLEASGYPFFHKTFHLILMTVIGSVSGILHLTPFLLGFLFPVTEHFFSGKKWSFAPFSRIRASVLRSSKKEIAILFLELAVNLLVLVLALQPSLSDALLGSHGLIYFTFLPVIWVGLNYPWFITVLTVFIVDTLIIVGAAFAGYDFFGPYELQILVIAISLVGYILALVMTDQSRMVRLLQDEKEKYHSVIKQTDEGIVLIDSNGKILEWNQGMEAITCISASLAVGSSWQRICAEICPDGKPAVLLSALEGISSVNDHNRVEDLARSFHLKLQPEDRAIRDVHLHGSYVSSGKNAYVVLVVRDVTDELNMQRALAESEERFRSTVEWAHEGIALVDESGSVIEWNRGVERFTAISRESALGKPINSLLDQIEFTTMDGGSFASVDLNIPQLASTLTDYPITDVIHLITNSKGEQYYVKYHLFLITTSTRGLICVVASDVSALVRSELELKRQSCVLNAVSEMAADLLNTGNIEEITKLIPGKLGHSVAVERVELFRAREADSAGWRVQPLVSWEKGVGATVAEESNYLDGHPSGVQKWIEDLSEDRIIEIYKSGSTEKERDLLHGYGSESLLVIPVNVHNSLWGFISFADLVDRSSWLAAEKETLQMAADILGSALEKREAELELVENQARAWTLLNAPDTAVFLVEKDGTISSVNQFLSSETGYDQQFLRGQPWQEIFPGEDQVLISESIHKVFTDGASVHAAYSTGNRWKETDFYPVFSVPGDVTGAAVFIRDVTEGRQLQREVQQRNRELQSLNSALAAMLNSPEKLDVLLALKNSLSENLDVSGGMLLADNPGENDFNSDLGWGLSEEQYLSIWKTAGNEWNTWLQAGEPFLLKPGDILVKSKGKETPRFAVYPLSTSAGVQGMVVLADSFDHDFDRNQVLFFNSLSQQAGVAIQNAHLLDELRKSQQHLRDLSGKIVRAQEMERRRVAHELHDEAGQALTALKIRLDLLSSEMDLNSEESRGSLEEAVGLAGRTMEHIRLLARDLRPPELEVLGLNHAMANLCEEFARRTGLAAEFTGLDVDDVRDEIAITLYRFLQESLTNITRHAYANSVRISLTQKSHWIVLEVEDDGCGFNVPEALAKPGRFGQLGLRGMGERLEVIGGRMWITSVPAEGTRVVAEVPRRESP